MTQTRSEPEPALQATPVWSAEMTVGTYDRYSPPGLGYSTWSRTGALSDRDFELGGTNYRVLALVEQAGGLYLVITREVPVEFTLAVGDQEFAASASSLPATAGSGRYWWDTPSELLAAGDTVNVSLAATDDAAAADRPLAPPAAYFTDIPASHNGTDSLTVKVSFSEEVALTATALRDDALDVSGATVTAVAQRAPASTKAWSVTVQPDGTADVAIGLAITTACDQTGAVCTADGRQLHNQPHSTISGPVTGNLSDLAVSGLDLNPAFDPGETFYTAQAPPDLAQVTVTATTARNDTTIEITPTDTDTTTPGHQVELNTDTDTIIAITTTSPDTAEQYWIAVSPPSENSSPTQPEIDPQLAQLGTLSLHGLPELNFTADQARYELDAPAGLTETIVVANPLFADAAIELLVIRSDDPTLAIDRTAADGLLVATDISLSATGDTALILRVTSPDGQQQNVYAVLIHRAAEAQPNSPGSSWLRQGFASWAPQPKSDITPKTTTPAADDAALSNLSLTGASLAPVFSPTTTAYIAEAAADVQYVTLSITTADAAATTAIWPADADLSTPGWQIPLTAPGIADIATKTMISIVVRSADSSLLNIYTIEVNRAAPENLQALGQNQAHYVPRLVELSVNGLVLSDNSHQLIPSFNLGVFNYYVPGHNSTDEYEINIRAATSLNNDLNISTPSVGTNVIRSWTYHKTDGASDPSVWAHGKSILASLSAGENVVRVDVTAEDGITVQSYTIRIVVGPKSDDAQLDSLVVNDNDTNTALSLFPGFANDDYFYTIKSDITSGAVLAVQATVPNKTATVDFESVDSHHSRKNAATRLMETEIQGAGYSGKVALFRIDDHTRARIHVKVTAEQRNKSNTYVVYVPASTEVHPTFDEMLSTDTEGLMVLPAGCSFHTVSDTSDGLQTQRQWLPACNSHLDYYGFDSNGAWAQTTGYARFFKMVVDEQGKVRIDISRLTSYFLVLRDEDGSYIDHRHVEIDGFCYIACSTEPIVKTLAAGTYIIEAVQMWSWQGKKEYVTLDVDSNVLG